MGSLGGLTVFLARQWLLWAVLQFFGRGNGLFGRFYSFLGRGNGFFGRFYSFLGATTSSLDVPNAQNELHTSIYIEHFTNSHKKSPTLGSGLLLNKLIAKILLL